MIDKVKIYKEVNLDIKKFDKRFKYKTYTKEPVIDFETGEVLKEGYTFEGYVYKHNSVAIIYSPKTRRLKVEGRLPNLAITRNLVHNLDDYMLGQEMIVSATEKEHSENYLCEHSWYNADDELCFPDATYTEYETVNEYIWDIVNNINEKLYDLTKVRFDILNFNITYAEVTFNIFDVEYVGRYIELFNMIFDEKQDKRYKNFVREMDLARDTSFYVKPKGKYDKNTKDAYTVNFYNKENQLLALASNPKNKSHVTHRDKRLAKNVLRLEVQLGYQELKKTEKVFKQLLDIFFCHSIIVEKYRWFISKNENLDFYSYQEAKKIIMKTDKLEPNERKGLLTYIQDKYQKNKKVSDQTRRKYNKLLELIGIHWCFIPTKWGINYLISPMKLLKEKIDVIIGQIDDIDEYLEWIGVDIEALMKEQEVECRVDETPFD